MTCPDCGATLQRLEKADGYRVESRLVGYRLTEVERRCLDVVYACSTCEHVTTGRVRVS